MHKKKDILIKMQTIDDDSEKDQTFFATIKRRLGRYVGLAVAVCYGILSC
jgi:hypothetical protein